MTAFVLLAPPILGGWTSYAIVSGTSMFPSLQDGDLVLVRERPSYHVGDIVLFPAEGGTVIHRIVGESEEGFIVRGDNKPRVDDWTPDENEILGSHVLSIPRVGAWVYDAQRNPHLFGALIGGLGSLGIASTRRKRRRYGAHAVEGHRRRRPVSVPKRSFTGAAVVVALLAFVGVVAGVFLVFMVTRPERLVQPLDFERFNNSGEFEVVATMAPSVIYSGTTIAISSDAPASAPIYASLLRSIAVGFRYTLDAAEGEITGSTTASLRIQAGDSGWVKDIELMPSQPFDETTEEWSFVISWPEVSSLIQAAEQQVGWSPHEYHLAVVAEVAIKGEVDGPVDETFVAELPLLLAGNELRVDSTALTTVQPVTERRLGQVPNVVELWNLSVPVEQGRHIAAVSFGVIVLTLAVYLLWLRRQAGDLEIARIRMMYGSMIASVVSAPSEGTRVAMASVADLVKLARKNEQMILYHRSRNEHRFFVPDGSVTYEYLLDSRRHQR